MSEQQQPPNRNHDNHDHSSPQGNPPLGSGSPVSFFWSNHSSSRIYLFSRLRPSLSPLSRGENAESNNNSNTGSSDSSFSTPFNISRPPPARVPTNMSASSPILPPFESLLTSTTSRLSSGYASTGASVQTDNRTGSADNESATRTENSQSSELDLFSSTPFYFTEAIIFNNLGTQDKSVSLKRFKEFPCLKAKSSLGNLDNCCSICYDEFIFGEEEEVEQLESEAPVNGKDKFSDEQLLLSKSRKRSRDAIYDGEDDNAEDDQHDDHNTQSNGNKRQKPNPRGLGASSNEDGISASWGRTSTVGSSSHSLFGSGPAVTAEPASGDDRLSAEGRSPDSNGTVAPAQLHPGVSFSPSWGNSSSSSSSSSSAHNIFSSASATSENDENSTASNSSSADEEREKEALSNAKHCATKLPCGHIFGTNCLFEWLKSSNTCPYCRAKIEDPYKSKEKKFVIKRLQNTSGSQFIRQLFMELTRASI